MKYTLMTLLGTIDNHLMAPEFLYLYEIFENIISLDENLIFFLLPLNEPCSGNNKSLVVLNSNNNNFIYVHICIWWCGLAHKIYFYSIHYRFLFRIVHYGPEIKNFSKNYLTGLYFSPVSAIYKSGFRTV